jgi:hypothetical protein
MHVLTRKKFVPIFLFVHHVLMYMYKLFPTQNMCCQARAESELAALRKQVEKLNQEKIRMDKFTMGGDSSPSLRGWDDSSVPSENNERTRRSRRQQPSQGARPQSKTRGNDPGDNFSADGRSSCEFVAIYGSKKSS